MSRLKELSYIYAKEDNCIPVEYYTPTGDIVKGAVQRVDGEIAVIVTNYVDTGIRSKINVNGFAGTANPQEWCLTRTAKAMYDVLGNPEVSEFANKNRQILQLIWKVFGDYYKPRFNLIKEWPGRTTIDLAGIILLNKPGEKRIGFLVYNNTQAPEFLTEIPKTVILEEFQTD